MAAKTPLSTHHHIVPIRTYVLTILALVILMITTVAIAEVNLPSIGPISGTVLNQGIALIIAITKAALVVSVFMGVWWSTNLTKFWAILGFSWLSFFSIFAGDYGTRQFEDVQGWEKTPAMALPRVHQEDIHEPGGVGVGTAATPDPNFVNIAPRQERKN